MYSRFRPQGRQGSRQYGRWCRPSIGPRRLARLCSFLVSLFYQPNMANRHSEHMMFLGTKTVSGSVENPLLKPTQYPVENEYSTYLSSNNGHSNAWTAMTSTNYFFDVAPDALEGALDRFSGFFYEPMFAEVGAAHRSKLSKPLRTAQNVRSTPSIPNTRRTSRTTCG